MLRHVSVFVFVSVYLCVCTYLCVLVYVCECVLGVLLRNDPRVFYKLNKPSTEEPPPQVLFLKLHKKNIFLVCECAFTLTCHCICVEVRRPPSGVSSLPSSRALVVELSPFAGLRQQACVSVDPSCKSLSPLFS